MDGPMDSQGGCSCAPRLFFQTLLKPLFHVRRSGIGERSLDVKIFVFRRRQIVVEDGVNGRHGDSEASGDLAQDAPMLTDPESLFVPLLERLKSRHGQNGT